MKKSLITLALLVTLLSCSPKPQSEGPSILENQICGKSCWNNVILGKTDTQEFLNIVTTLPNVAQSSIHSYDELNQQLFDERITFQYYRDSGEEVNVLARTKKQQVVLITFQGGLGLTFDDIVKIFGEPDFATSLWTFDGGINVHFINSLEGVEVTSYFESEKSSITPTLEINSFTLFDPNIYQTLIDTDYIIADHEYSILYPWTGYGVVEQKYWPPE